MANWVAPTRIDADNTSGSLPAARTDWRSVGRFHVGTGQIEPTIDAGYTTACAIHQPNLSVSFLAFVHGVPIGTVRLIMHGPKEFPIFREFGMPNEYFKHPSTEIKMGEVSRFICMPYDGGPRHAVSLALLQVLVRYSVHAGLTHWLQAMDATAYRLVRFFGFPLERFAPSKKFMGSMTHPTICGVQKSFQVFEKRFPDTFTLMSKDWAATEVVAVAGRALQARVAYS